MSNISDEFKLRNESKKIKKIDMKERLILEKNRRFFSHNRKYVDSMLKIINGESKISIRLLDWFISNYSKKKNTYYFIKVNSVNSEFFVYREYKNQLAAYSKDYFDPFCRKRKIVYSYKDEDGKNPITFMSSIGQLNFFQWAIRSRIIMYVENHYNEIDLDMKKSQKENKLLKESSLNNPVSDEASEAETGSESESDDMICSTDSINRINLSSSKSKVKFDTDSESTPQKSKRRQLSKSVFDQGIVKTHKKIALDFD
jgi:hypothetical protein